jgi:thymidylate synthase (FAD)
MQSAKVVAITQPVIDGITTAEEFIAYAARVSAPTNQMNTETAPKLLGYLIKNRHWSPMEMVQVTLELNTTRDIARQILRHRSFSFQEFSQRYQTVNELGFTTRECRLQDTKNRQNSVEIHPLDESNLISDWEEKQEAVLNLVKETYNWALDKGIAKEQARSVLPEGLTKSRLYMAGTLRSWITYIALREKNGTQKEHQQIAKMCKEEIIKYFPVIGQTLGVQSDWVI